MEDVKDELTNYIFEKWNEIYTTHSKTDYNIDLIGHTGIQKLSKNLDEGQICSELSFIFKSLPNSDKVKIYTIRLYGKSQLTYRIAIKFYSKITSQNPRNKEDLILY
jgi:hypothetical protein